MAAPGDSRVTTQPPKNSSSRPSFLDDLDSFNDKLLKIPLRFIARPFVLQRPYGTWRAIILTWFGSLSAWRTLAHVLGSLDDQVALQFRKSVQDECNMVAVAGAIVAQVSITALNLDDPLQEVPWIAQSAILLSLVAALSSVYYALSQQRIMGRLFEPSLMRAWIRGQTPEYKVSVSDVVLQRCSDPFEFRSSKRGRASIEEDFIVRCFAPSTSAVLSLSAPQLLLSVSLVALLLAIALYVNAVYARREVFALYMVSLGLCWIVYMLSSAFSSSDSRDERKVLRAYFEEYKLGRVEKIRVRGSTSIAWLQDKVPNGAQPTDTTRRFSPSSNTMPLMKTVVTDTSDTVQDVSSAGTVSKSYGDCSIGVVPVEIKKKAADQQSTDQTAAPGPEDGVQEFDTWDHDP